MSARRENAGKVFLTVRADHLPDGRVRPLLFRAPGAPSCRIDRVLDEREAPSLRAGGQGTRYLCEVDGRIVALFHDDLYWFLEAD